MVSGDSGDSGGDGGSAGGSNITTSRTVLPRQVTITRTVLPPPSTATSAPTHRDQLYSVRFLLSLHNSSPWLLT